MDRILESVSDMTCGLDLRKPAFPLDLFNWTISCSNKTFGILTEERHEEEKISILKLVTQLFPQAR